MPKRTKRIVDGLPIGKKQKFFWDSELKGLGVAVRPPSRIHPDGSKVSFFDTGHSQAETEG